MAGALIALGAEIDIASGRELEDSEHRVLGAIRDSKAIRPLTRKIVMTATSATGPDLLQSVSGPAAGKEWHITKLAVGVDDDHTTLAGASAALYCAANPFLDLMQCEIPGITPLPYFNAMGDKRVIALPGEFIYIVGYGITAGHQIWSTITIDEYPINFEQMRI